MRNLKKLLAVIVVICVLASSMVSAFAAESFTYDAQAQKLYDMGLFKGNSASEYVPNLGGSLTREAGTILLVRLFGVEADALKVTDADTILAGYTDAKNVSPWAKSYVAYAVQTKLVEGTTATNLSPSKALDGNTLATLILRKLGYTVSAADFSKAAATLVEKGGITAEQATKFAGKDLIRDDAVGIMFGSLMAKDTDNKTVIAKLIAAKVVDEAKAIAAGVWTAAPATLEVADVTANNLKEIAVKFNRPVTEEIKAEYFTVSGSSKIAVAKSEDKTTVIISETTTNGAFGKNQEQVDVTVKKALGLAADFTKKISLFDATIPEAKSVRLTGPNTFEVTFSEPIIEADGCSISVNNGVYGVTSYKADGTAVVKVTLSAGSLAEGTYKIKVKGYKDAAGYTAMDKEFDLAYVKDTTVPTATVKSFTQKEVVIEFNKPVTNGDSSNNDLAEKYFYHTFSSYYPTKASVSDDNKTFTLDFSNHYLPEGKVKVVVDYDAYDKAIRDGWGNKLTGNLEFTLDVSSDKVAPEVAEIKATAQNTIEVTFSEKLDADSAVKTANYAIKDADQKDVGVSKVEYKDADKKVIITTSKEMTGKYTIAFKDIKDTALEGNVIVAVTKEINVVDVTRPLLTSISAIAVDTATEDYVYVTFPEKMATTGQYSILNKDNYLVSGKTLTADDTVTLFGDETRVKITIADETLANEGRDITVARVADAAGNASLAMATAGLKADKDKAPIVTAVKTINKNTLEITFDRILNTITADGIIVAKKDLSKSGTLAAVSKTDKDNKTTLVATLKEELQLTSSDDVDSLIVITDSGKLVSDTGSYVNRYAVTKNASAVTTLGSIGYAKSDSAVDIKDGYKVSISSASTTASAIVTNGISKIDLVFDEAVTTGAIDVSNAAYDFIVKYDGTELVPVKDYTVAISNKTVTITLKKSEMAVDKKVTVALRSTVNFLTDLAGNTPNAFDAKEITLK